MNKVIIWGAGNRGRQFIKENLVEKKNVIAFIDNDRSKQIIENINVYSPEYLEDVTLEYDYLLISVFDFLNIFSQCIALNLDKNKIIIGRIIMSRTFKDNTIKLRDVFPKLFKNEAKHAMGLIALNESDFFDDNNVFWKLADSNYSYQYDYFRFRTFELTAKLIQNVEGAVAELGVYKGDFSKFINQLFPNRKLYLYDTFNGFGVEEAFFEISKGRATEEFVTLHKNGSLSDTLDKIEFKDNIYIRQGYFPESIKEEDKDEIFAFVSLDVDFEESTYEGLCFFYPRLSDGGMIFLHDFFTYFLEGIREAVVRFEKDYNLKLKKVSLADRAGTLVIIK